MIDIPCITLILSKIGKSLLNFPLLIFVIRLDSLCDSLGILTIFFVIDSSIHSEKISGVQFCQNFNCFELLTKQLFLNFYFKVRMQSPHIGLIVRLYCKFKGFFQHNKPF